MLYRYPPFPILHPHSSTMNPSSSSSSCFLLPLGFLILLVLRPVFSAPSSANVSVQLVSLLSLKSSLKDPYDTFRDWDPTSALSKPGFENVWCSWSGIKCDKKTGFVTGINLSGRGLSGEIPADIRYLLHLHHLNLSSNVLGGPLPPVLFQFPFLRSLDVSRNNFSSIFPPGISRLKSLTHFDAFSNNFTGPLPGDVVHLPNLEYLNFGGSYFGGEIPASYGSFVKLRFLYLAGNLLSGPIPPELGFLNQLEHLQIGCNLYSGGVPPQFGSLSNLAYLDIQSANLSGPLPPQLGNLTKLEIFIIYNNSFAGAIPYEFGKLTSLKELDLSDNFLSGPIPTSLSSLQKLRLLSLMNNNLTGQIPEPIGDLPELEILNLWTNNLSGILPQKLGSNEKLQKLDVSTNSLSGPIPPNLCRGNKLEKLILFGNHFIGALPESLANCTALCRVRIQNNNLNGSIPVGFGAFPNLTLMDISRNSFGGQIPRDLGNAGSLVNLNVSQNSFQGELPDNIWKAPSLQVFSGSYSNLSGKIPDFKGCQALANVELQGNNLTGSIPWDIADCQKLIMLNLGLNSLSGIIPWEISTLPSIADVDLSHNFLTGTIPSNFGNCSTLESFNVSFNRLSGPLPVSSSIFSSLHPSSFIGNDGLCGSVIQKPCRSDAPPPENKQQPKKTAGAVVWIVAAAFGICLFVLVVGSRCFHARYSLRFSGDRGIGPWKLTAFQRLNFTADDVMECLSMSDQVIGMGSAGTVYKAEMPGGEIIAVKKLWGKQKETVRKRPGVLAEVDVLGNVRHRNIVRLLGCCSNNECTMLLYEYMPNGSLDDLLHSKNKATNLAADWVTRYKIALGVAQGICYLHHDCDPIIVHRDLKPSNILLDNEMEARVADFGVAKLIQSDESMSVIAGSYGYIAPEYAYTLQVDEKSDIYSYGVVLMEILTGKRSVDAEFGDGNSVVDWVRTKLKSKDGIKDVLDKNAGASYLSVREEMMLLLRVALLCTSRNPADRPSMRDVVSMLQEAKPKRKVAGNGGGNGAVGGGDVIPVAQKATFEG